MNCLSLCRKKFLINSLCGLIVVGSWAVCFLPTFLRYFLTPVKPQEDTNQSLPTPSQSTHHFMPSSNCNYPLIWHNDSGTCKPSCDWSLFTKHQQDVLDIVEWMEGVFYALFLILGVITCLKIPEFWTSPQVIILLISGVKMIIEFLILIPKFSNRSTFFCPSPFLDEANRNPTTFCQVQGALIHYITLVCDGWGVVYALIILKTLVIDNLPSLEYNKRKLIILSLLCFSLPVIPITIVLKSDEKYVPYNFRICVARDSSMGFFSWSFLNQVFLSVTVTCFLMVIFKLIKERKSLLIGFPSQAKIRQHKFERAAVSAILVIILCIVCGFLSDGPILIILKRNRLVYQKTVGKYFACLTVSQDCQKDSSKFEPLYQATIFSVFSGSLFMAGLVGLLARRRKVRTLWRSWLSLLTVKCRSLKRNPVKTSKRPTDYNTL